jgi:glyoxylase-like metal-dependent hydrolase (beta-lactamase superfamily II)
MPSPAPPVVSGRTTIAPEQVADGVYRIADGIVNWYLVDDGGCVALYDAGWPSSWPRVRAALSAIGRTPADVSAIVLTHAHPDHLGAAEAARKACGAPVWVHRPEVARAHGDAPGSSPFTLVPGLLPTMWRPSATGFVLHATARGFMFPTWVADVTPFDVGERLDLPGQPRPVATPGHTEGHVSFVFESRGVVITGDAIATLNVLTRDRGPQVMPDQLNSDAEQTRASLDVLAGLPVDVMLPGHGDPFRGDPAEAVTLARLADD